MPTVMLSIESSILNNSVYNWFYDIHSNVAEKEPGLASPRHFLKLINAFRSIFNKKRSKITDRQNHLKVTVDSFS
jgi:hypothetical protein